MNLVRTKTSGLNVISPSIPLRKQTFLGDEKIIEEDSHEKEESSMSRKMTITEDSVSFNSSKGSKKSSKALSIGKDKIPFGNAEYTSMSSDLGDTPLLKNTKSKPFQIWES